VIGDGNSMSQFWSWICIRFRARRNIQGHDENSNITCVISWWFLFFQRFSSWCVALHPVSRAHSFSTLWNFGVFFFSSNSDTWLDHSQTLQNNRPLLKEKLVQLEHLLHHFQNTKYKKYSTKPRRSKSSLL